MCPIKGNDVRDELHSKVARVRLRRILYVFWWERRW